MNEQKIQPVRGLHLAVENGETVLKNICNEVEITIFFAEEEPARNAKEACLSIIGRQYESRAVAGESKPPAKPVACSAL